MRFTLWTPLQRFIDRVAGWGLAAYFTIESVMAKSLRGPCAAFIVLVTSLIPAAAQQFGAPPAPPGAARNPVCIRLEGQLAALDRGGVDPARADQIKRLEDAAGKAQADLDRLSAQGRRMGCEGRGLFSIFSEQPQQCGPLNNQIQQLRANLDRLLTELQRAQGNTVDREGQRRALLVSLGQNDCGAQYRNFANQSTGGNFFERLFGPGPSANSNVGLPEAPQVNNGTYRTLSVRTCDGYYFPISSSATPTKFAEDEKACQRLCPAADTALYTHRNPGEDVSQAVSISGRNYTELPTAFAYRKQFTASCSCKQAGQTWADALKGVEDRTIERGDIVVDEERARQLSLPPDQQKRAPAARPAAGPARTPSPGSAPTPLAPTAEDTDPSRRNVRPVGPTYLPPR
jgi:hypothetical protein